MNRKELLLPILACVLAVLITVAAGLRVISVREDIKSACAHVRSF